MASTFDIAGHHVNKWVVYGGVGVAVVGGVLYFRSKSSSSSSSSTGSGTSSSSIDPVTGLPYSEDSTVDPLTGLTYLSEAEQYGSVSAAEEAVSAGYSSTGAAGEGYSGEAYGTPTENYATSDTETYATNAEWAAAVQAALPAITGDSSSDVATAVANYLAGLPLSTAQANDIQVALAEFGPPPSGSFSIVAASSSSGATSTGSATSPGSGATTTTTGTPATAAPKPILVAPSGFRVVSVTNGDNVNLAWDALKPPAGEGPLTGYVIAYGPTSGSQQYKQTVGGQTTAATVAGVGAGSAGKHYFELWATPAASGGPHAGPIEASTTKS